MSSDAQKKATRDGFGEGLLELGKTNSQVIVVSADLTESTRAGWFKERYPDRFVSCGVAEQDMMGVAAGAALRGKIPFVCTFGVFASGRAWDQIRVSLAYMNLNVTIAGTHGGLTVGEDGATHQAIEEVALMRCLPRMTVVVPADANEAKLATIQSASIPGPVYLRLGRSAVPVVGAGADPFTIGTARILRGGDAVSICACGIMVCAALEAAEELARDGIDAEVIDVHTIKPLDARTILASVRKTRSVVTAEEHTVMGGLGSAISELLVQHDPVPLRMVGVNDVFGESGAPAELLKKFKLTPAQIVAQAREAVRAKKRTG